MDIPVTFYPSTEMSVVMDKGAAKRAILRYLTKSEMALPPKTLYRNLIFDGESISNRTVHRHVSEMAEDGLIRHIDGTPGYYAITQTGREYLKSEGE